MNYLVEVGDTSFVVNQRMYDFINLIILQPKNVSELSEMYASQNGEFISEKTLFTLLDKIPPTLLEDSKEVKKKHPFIIKFDILTPKIVTFFSSRLAWLYNKYLAFVIVLLFFATLVDSFSSIISAIHFPIEPGEASLILISVLGIALFHEFGHATACQRFNCPNGVIGIGLYYFFPVFYTDVTKAWRLQPYQRSVVDIGGIFFQFIVQVFIFILSLIHFSEFYYKLMWLNLFIILQNLNPVLKMDGYWLLSDLSKIHNLHKFTRDFVLRTISRYINKVKPPKTSFKPYELKYSKWILAYIFLVLLQTAYMLHFLIIGIQTIVNIYPPKINKILIQILNEKPFDFSLLMSFIISFIYPLIIIIVTVFFLLKIFRMIKTVYEYISTKKKKMIELENN